MEGNRQVPERIVNEAATSSNPTNDNSWDLLENNDDHFLLVDEELNLNTSILRSDERYIGFDNNVGDSWIYPSNFPERAYQYNIVQKALFHNTLVVLPTGLGKTFIAAVVMYNMYRWYPMGKVIFMAPTRPLVTQQIDACCKIMGIPKEDSVEITGKLNKSSRAQLWQSKRVFFATPQSVQSDITDTELNFPFHAVKLIVVDEAHRAKGRYAYTDVISYIWRKNKYFRILALSATPGRRKDDVEEIIRNLFISNLEVRTEDSVDVVSYVHKRLMKTVVVELGQRLSNVRDELLAIADPHLRNLIDNRLIAGRPGSISRNWLVMEQKKFRATLLNNRIPNQKELSSDFSICISVYHAIELLERHGLRVFLNNFDETQEGGAKFVVILRPDLRRLIERVREEIGPNPFAYSDQCMVNGQIAAIPMNIDFGHPKFEIARDHVLTHFENNKEARVIIFCEYRESVMLMHRLLLQQRPLIRPRVFVGQGGTGSIRAVTQQQQINVMNDFRNGESNALIATSVAEEGIDVGEVDLIVCFDISSSNPTRFIQRIGRTGRKKEGKVLLLATEGKEHSMLKDVLSERNKLNKSISRGGEFASIFYKHAPRMVPTEFNPKCLKSFIQPTLKQQPAQSKAKRHKAPKIVQTRDLRHFFKQTITLDDEEMDIFDGPEAPSVSKVNKSDFIRTIASEETPSIMNFSAPKSDHLSKKTARNIAKYVRNRLKRPTNDTQKALTSNKLFEDSLKFLLDFSPDLPRIMWTRMLDLWKRGIDENNIPAKGITSEDRQAIRAYLQMIKVFGSKENIASLVESRVHVPDALTFSYLMEKYSFIFNDLSHKGTSQDNFEFLMEKFEKVSKLFSSDEYSKASYVQSMVYDEIDDIDRNTSKFNESSRDYSTDCIMDSKYMSQWEEPQHSLVCESQQPPAMLRRNSKNPDKSKRIDPKPNKSPNENSDDDVVIVDVARQSTPIRTVSYKQLTLNFKETPILKTVVERRKDEQTQATSSKKNIEKLCLETLYERLEPLNENSFFDDQFDAIIAANSGVIESIEKGSGISRKKKKENTEVSSLNESNNLDLNEIKEVIKTASGLNLHKSAPNSVLPSMNVREITPNRGSHLSANDSTPDGIVALSTESERPSLNRNVAINDLTGLISTIHPELENINFNDFLETFSDEINETCTAELIADKEVHPQSASPDIFEELTQPNPQAKYNEKSPLKPAISPPTQISPCLLTKNALTWREVRLKYGRSSQSESKSQKFDRPNDSVIHAPAKTRLKRRIIDSDTDSSENGLNELNRQQNTPTPTPSRKLVHRRSLKKPLPQKRTNQFIDDEAAFSGSASDDEFEQTIGCYMPDSVVVHDDDAEADLVNMTEVYLQSVRSPRRHFRGAFKIPESRHYNDHSKIFSQKVTEDSTSYGNDSFVVSDEEADIDQSMCPLERAEEILKAKRRTKRKAKSMAFAEQKQTAKRKRVLRIHNSSEDDD